MVKWFVYDQNQVFGPFNTEQVKGQIHEGYFPQNCRIWGRNQTLWLSPKEWGEFIGNNDNRVNTITPHENWHYADNGTSFGPFHRDEFIQSLKRITNINENILVWKEGMEDWASLFEFHDILRDLNIDVRVHPRKEIQGQVTFIHENQEIQGQLYSISVGGVGVIGIKSWSAGQSVIIDIESPDLKGKKYRIKAQVRYVTKDFHSGLQFESLGAEATSSIVEYIKSNEGPEKLNAA